MVRTSPATRCFRLCGEIDGRVFSAVVPVGTARVGSARDNEIRLAVPGVSRLHARLVSSGELLEVEDAGSRNGTFVNGLRVARAELRDTDWLQLGPLALRVETIDPADAELAIAGHGAARPEPADVEPSKATEGWSAAHAGGRPALLAVVAGVAARLADEPTVSLAELLADLAAGLGASSAALVCLSPQVEPRVLGAWGGALDGYPEMPDASGCRQAPPCAWAVHRNTGPERLVLVAGGEALDCPSAIQVLEAVLHLLRPRAGSRGKPVERPRSRPDFAVPEGYVPGRSRAMVRLHEEVRQLLPGDFPVLITGETGVGKEWVARLLHASSPRRAGPFVAVNCAAIPSELLEAELFGIERAVATGVASRTGKLEQASGGVVFLDEIGDMPLALQAKLLRALQHLEIEPVGGRSPRRVDVRVIAATNTDIERRVAEGAFRRDLYYRLAGYTLTVPALRQRRDDIPLLVEHLLARVCRETGRAVASVTVGALEALCSAPWPGNVRELEHEVRRLVVRCPEGQPIDSSMLSACVLRPPATAQPEPEPEDLDLATHVEALERRLLALALGRAHGNRSQAARLLGLSRPGLLMKLRRLGLDA